MARTEKLKYYTFKNGLFRIRVPGKDEDDARKALPQSIDFGTFKLIKVEKEGEQVS